MIQLKNLLLEVTGKLIYSKSTPAKINAASNIFCMIFRIKEFSPTYVPADSDKEVITPISNKYLLGFISKQPGVGESSRYANGEYYYILGEDLKEGSERKEFYDVLIFPKNRTYNVIRGQELKSNINDYLAKTPRSIGKIGQSEVITFKEFYDCLDASATANAAGEPETTYDGIAISGTYLRKVVSNIIDPKNNAAIGSKERIQARDKEDAIKKLSDWATKKLEDLRSKCYYKDDEKQIFALRFEKVITTEDKVALSYYVYEAGPGAPKFSQSDIQQLPISSEQDNVFENTFYSKLSQKVEFSENTFISEESWNNIIYDANGYFTFKKIIENKKQPIDPNNKDKEVTGKVVLQFKDKFGTQFQYDENKLLSAFGFVARQSETTRLTIDNDEQKKIIQACLLDQAMWFYKSSHTDAEKNFIKSATSKCLNTRGKFSPAEFKTLGKNAIDGNYGTKTKDMSRFSEWQNRDATTKNWASYQKNTSNNVPTFILLLQTCFSNTPVIFESKIKQLSNLIFGNDNVQTSTTNKLKSLTRESKIKLLSNLIFEYTPPVTEPENNNKPEPKNDKSKDVNIINNKQDGKDKSTEPDSQETNIVEAVDVVLFTGLTNVYPQGNQLAALEKGYNDKFITRAYPWESAKSLTPNAKKHLKTAKHVICFSKACEYADNVASEMTDKSRLWIVEPYGTKTIPAGVPNNHVILGPSSDRGADNFEEGMIQTPKGIDHFGALTYVGELIGNSSISINDIPKDKDRSEEERLAALLDKYDKNDSRGFYNLLARANTTPSLDTYVKSAGSKSEIRFDVVIEANNSLDKSGELLLGSDGTIALYYNDTLLLRGIYSGWSDSGKKITAELVPEGLPRTGLIKIFDKIVYTPEELTGNTTVTANKGSLTANLVYLLKQIGNLGITDDASQTGAAISMLRWYSNVNNIQYTTLDSNIEFDGLKQKF